MALKPATKFLAEQKRKRKKAMLRKKRSGPKPTSEDKRYDAIGKAMEDYPNVHGVRRRC